MTYPLENGIPMPSACSGPRAARYPMREIKVGQSFLIPSSELPKHVGQSVRNSAAYYGKKVAVRKVKGGVRVWRTA